MIWIVGLGIFDILWAFVLFLLFLGSQFSFICGLLLGLFCFITSIGILNKNALIRKIFLRGSLALSLMSVLNLLIFIGKDVQEGFRMSVSDVIVFSVMYIFTPLVINFIILNCRKIKEQFK